MVMTATLYNRLNTLLSISNLVGVLYYQSKYEKAQRLASSVSNLLEGDKPVSARGLSSASWVKLLNSGNRV